MLIEITKEKLRTICDNISLKIEARRLEIQKERRENLVKFCNKKFSIFEKIFFCSLPIKLTEEEINIITSLDESVAEIPDRIFKYYRDEWDIPFFDYMCYDAYKDDIEYIDKLKNIYRSPDKEILHIYLDKEFVDLCEEWEEIL